MTYPPDELDTICQLLLATFADLTTATAMELAVTLAPYIQRAHHAWDIVVPRIAANYRRDHLRVAALIEDRDPAAWQTVLLQVIAVASRSRLYPRDQEAGESPDIDAYEDVRQKLAQYNFEGSLDGWIATTVVRRLKRFWRDRQSLRSGGAGFGIRDLPTTSLPRPVAPRRELRSLEAMNEDGMALDSLLADDTLNVAARVESAELCRLVNQRVSRLAQEQHDPLLSILWHRLHDEQLRLREAALATGLSVAQVHRRLGQVKACLRTDPGIQAWLHHRE